MTFETSDDIPFAMRGGDSQETAMYNRIAAINRINYIIRQKLPEFDIRTKSAEYRKFLDLEMYRRYYASEAKDKKIDEEFCQRMAGLCIEFDEISGMPVSIVETEKFKELLKTLDAAHVGSVLPEQKIIKKSFIAKILDKFKK